MNIYTLIRAENASKTPMNSTQLTNLVDELGHLRNDVNHSMGAVGKLMKCVTNGGATQLDEELTHQLGYLFALLSDINFLCDDHEHNYRTQIENNLKHQTAYVGGEHDHTHHSN